MKSYVNINHYSQDIQNVEIRAAKILSIEKDAVIINKNDAYVSVSRVTISAQNNIYTLNLWGKWRTMASYMSIGDTINVIDGKARNFNESKEVNILDGLALSCIVLEPSVLINATDMAGIAIKLNHYCFFLHHQRRMRLGSVVNYYVIKGNIVGNIFDEFISDTDNFNFDASFDKYLAKEKLKFLAVDYVPNVKNIKEDVKKDLRSITDWYLASDFKLQEPRIEPYFISPKFGLVGRMDILFKDKNESSASIIELKTGRFPEDKSSAWINHKFQAIAYDLIYDSVFDNKARRSYILYSGSQNALRELDISSDLKRNFIFLRNKMVFNEKRYLDFDYDTMRSFRRDTKECGNCKSFQKDKCDEIFNTFELLSADEEKYYFSFYKMVERERIASMKKNSLLFGDDSAGDGRDKYVLTGLDILEFNAERGLVTFKLHEQASEMREGDSVIIHSGNPEKEELIRAEIVTARENSITLKLSNPFLKRLSADIKWTVCRYNTLISAGAMFDGLYRFVRSPKRFRDLIMLNRNPEFDDINTIHTGIAAVNLNDAQKRAVKKSVCSRDYALLQGPPGTGKTKTAAAIIMELIKRKQRVILSALTNRAVDNVLMRLRSDYGFDDFIRVGSMASVEDSLHANLLSSRADAYDISDIKSFKAEVKRVPLIATTTTSASVSFIFDDLTFDVAVIDEASQISEPSIFAALDKARKFIMIGDLYQLGPVMKSDFRLPAFDPAPAGVIDLKKTLFERLWEHNTRRNDIEEDNDPCVTLDIQYRMNDEIIRFSNSAFYGGALKTDASAHAGRISLSRDNPLYDALDPQIPVLFIDVPQKNSLRENKSEADVVTALVKNLVEGGISPSDIGIISPFKAQCALIRRMIEPQNPDGKIVVDTVERFQGTERDVIIASFVVGDDFGLDFLKENDGMNKKLNVTLTRACKKLILVGNKQILSKDPIYSALISSIQKKIQNNEIIS